MSKKEVTKVESKELAEVGLDAWGQEEVEVSSNDLVIPKLWLMQPLSEMVAEKELAKAGEIVDSLSEEVIGGPDKPVKIVPFKVEKLWYTIKDNGDKGELVSIDAVTKENEGLEREYELDGDKYKRMFTYKFFCVKEGSSLPFIIIFKSTSIRAGKQMFTEMYIKNRMAGKSPAAKYMEISSEKKKNEKGTFFVFTVKAGDDAPVELQTMALDWFKTLKVETFKEASDDAKPATAENNAQF